MIRDHEGDVVSLGYFYTIQNLWDVAISSVLVTLQVYEIEGASWQCTWILFHRKDIDP